MRNTIVSVLILGTSHAVPDVEHGNTHMLIQTDEHNILIDCAGDIIQRLQKAEVPIERLTDLILTHFHPDHVSGAPLLLLGLWIMGRKEPLTIYGSQYTLERMQTVMELYEWKTWPGFYPVTFQTIEEKEFAPVLLTKEVRILASPVAHMIPTIGLRVEFPQTGKTMAYSCDTSPCEQVIRLAENVDRLLHESAGDSNGHTSAAQAAKIANEAQAKALYLIHYAARGEGLQAMKTEAEDIFTGPVAIAEDYMRLDFS
jgi:ribonuclease Z